MKLLLATGNQNKVKELQYLLKNTAQIISSPIEVEVDEYGATCSANAIIKAKEYLKVLKNKNLLPDVDFIIADDSGIFVPELGNNIPGVLSARFSLCEYKDKKLYQTNKKANDNIDLENNKLLLKLMSNNVNRLSYYLSALALISNTGEFINLLEGVAFGTLGEEIIDTNGWGYDHVFISETGNHWGKVSSEVKNAESHRAKAVIGLRDYLTNSGLSLSCFNKNS